MKILSNKSCYMGHLISKATRVDFHSNNVNREAGLVCIRSWNLSFTPSEHRGTLQCLQCPTSPSGYASLSPLLICCFCCTSLHLDHVVDPCSPCEDFKVPIKPNNPNLLSSESSHYPLQDPAVLKSLTIYIHLLRTGDTSLSSSCIAHLTSALIRTPTTIISHPHLPWLACHYFIAFTNQTSTCAHCFAFFVDSSNLERYVHYILQKLMNHYFIYIAWQPQRPESLTSGYGDLKSCMLLPPSIRPIINREDFNDKVNSFLTGNNFKELMNYPTWTMHKQTYCNHGNLCNLLTNQWYYIKEII